MYKPTIAPMGWNSWDCFGAAVTESKVRANAEYMAKNLKESGYEYIVVDVQWYEPGADSHEYRPFAELCMDEYGRLIPAPNRFPSSEGGKGFKPLADYVHSLGLKFGIHIMRGIPRQAVYRNLPILNSDKTAKDVARHNSVCAWNPDMYGVSDTEAGKAYYDSIFSLYASWGVDFIKCDDIARELPHEEKELIMLSKALHECGRDMVLSLSPGPALLEKAELYKEISNMWRITDDFWDDWKLLYAMFERAEKWSTHAGLGHFPDADMLPVGPIRQDYGKENRTKFTKDEQITMLTLWSIMRSPLIIGGDMPGFDDFTLKLLTDADILKMHRESRHAHQVMRKEINGTELIVWIAANAEIGNYVAFFNAGEADIDMEFPLEELEIYGEVTARSLWDKKLEKSVSSLKLNIKKHGAVAFMLI